MKKAMQVLPKITLKQLSVFVSIYQTGSTSRASEELHLSQSAVSSALTELEARLQMPLFERVGRRLNQHPNAHPIYIQAQAILGQALTLEHYHKHQAGQIHIGASTTIGNYVLPPLLAKLYEALPDAHIDMYIANTQEVVGEVEQLNIDIALVEGMPRPTDMKVIEQRAWRTDTLMVFAITIKKNAMSSALNDWQGCHYWYERRVRGRGRLSMSSYCSIYRMPRLSWQFSSQKPLSIWSAPILGLAAYRSMSFKQNWIKQSWCR
jgi:hypothetical protein